MGWHREWAWGGGGGNLQLKRDFQNHFQKSFSKNNFSRGRAFLYRGSGVSRYECRDNGVKMY